MTIKLDDIGRRFNQEWIFRGLNYQFESGGKYAVLGPNGSGKSTLLSVILGNLTPSAGHINYQLDKEVPVEQIYKHVSFAAPYLDLIEEFTLQETIDFHFQFKQLYPGLSKRDVLAQLGLGSSEDKPLKYFSSGMKQRTKLVLACCTADPLLLLDEPGSNLDAQGLAWYQELIAAFSEKKTVIVGSNQEFEYSFCNHFVQIKDYK
ncbi:ABC transporter ATP-binding protein [Pedobacter sp. GR22-6]|uniref:ABC transporter ATP-binding protein n=1 Tax=Pedobacter sp. GR22-6 TaxID=3127957 RepID=UPI00307F778D